MTEHSLWRSWQYDDYPRDRDAVIEFLDQCRAACPGFRATVFAVPDWMRRRDWEPLHARREWVQVGPHGFRHDRRECRDQNIYSGKIALIDRFARDRAWGAVYKAPWWGYSREFIERLTGAGFAFGIACISDDWGYPPVAGARAWCWNDWRVDTPTWQHWSFHPRATRAGEFKMSKTSIDDRSRREYLDSLRPGDRFEFVGDMAEPLCIKINLGCGKQVWPGWQCFDRLADEPGVRRWEWPNRIPYTHCRADVVLMSHVLEYVPEECYEDILLDVWRVLRPGGVLRMSDLDGYVWRAIGSTRTRGTGKIESHPTWERVRRALWEVGFQVFPSRPGETISPHNDVLRGDTRSRVWRRGKKFYADCVKAQAVTDMKRIRWWDPRMDRNGRYRLVSVPKMVSLFFRHSAVSGNRREVSR